MKIIVIAYLIGVTFGYLAGVWGVADFQNSEIILALLNK